ncbi:hypothetical protein TNCV_4645091 [Trichonephila clavipes]|nr:hypothetical protein TNCV_4645091 [Trichonephila clavipes]
MMIPKLPPSSSSPYKRLNIEFDRFHVPQPLYKADLCGTWSQTHDTPSAIHVKKLCVSAINSKLGNNKHPQLKTYCTSVLLSFVRKKNAWVLQKEWLDPAPCGVLTPPRWAHPTV